MAITVTHQFVSGIADSGDTSVVQPSDWNAAHTLAGLGTGVETALAINVGSAGAPVVNGGALGTPSSGTLTNCTGLPVAGGGTGASDASGARTNLGLVIGTNVQAWDAQLDDLAGIAPTKGRLIVGDGTNWVDLGVGTDTHVLTADSAQTKGVKWAAASGGGGTPGGSSGQLQYNNASSFDGSLLWQDTNVIEQYNSTNAQSLRVYNTRTDASNYERGFMRWSSNIFEIGTAAAGTGTANRTMRLSAYETIQIWNSQYGFSTLTLNSSTASFGVLVEAQFYSCSRHVEFTEYTDPAAPISNKARLYARDNGSGKTQICVLFPTGAVQVIATEP